MHTTRKSPDSGVCEFLLPFSMVRAVNGNGNADSEFLLNAIPHILGGSQVATTTAGRLATEGVDVMRLARIFAERGRELVIAEYRLKLIDADPDTPENFGVFVRRLQRSA